MPAAGKCALQKLNAGIMCACLIGLELSYYAYIVETRKEQDDSYEALCDITETVSCTKVFTTEYGKGFGLLPKDSMFNIPNSIYGLAFHTTFAVLSMINDYTCTATIVVLGILSNISSIYFGHILYILKNVCVVCISTYVVNIVITVLAIKKFRKLTAGGTHEKKRK